MQPAMQSREAPTLLQGNGFYMGIAYWPGGRIADWGATLNTTTNVKGLNPCTSNNNYNKTGISDRAYLVSFWTIISIMAFDCTK